MFTISLQCAVYAQTYSVNTMPSNLGIKESNAVPSALLKFELLSIGNQQFKSLPTQRKFGTLLLFDMAFFCKLEEKNLKASQIPLKIRLGDFDYANHLEGKGTQLPIIEK